MPPTLRVMTGDKRDLGLAEYVWIEESKQHSKSRIIQVARDSAGEPVPIIEYWTISTPQGQRLLSPCHYVPDPLRGPLSFIVLCEIRDPQDVPTETNHRAILRHWMDQEGGRLFLWWGFRQPYYLLTESGVPPAGACAAVAERHLRACIDAGIMIHSAHTDQILGEFKVGVRRMPKEIDYDEPNALVVSDHLWIARHLLNRVATEAGILVDYRTNTRGSVFLSTAAMRDTEANVREMALVLQSQIGQPFQTRINAANRCPGYIEAKYMAANTDPYVSTAKLIETIISWKGQ